MRKRDQVKAILLRDAKLYFRYNPETGEIIRLEYGRHHLARTNGWVPRPNGGRKLRLRMGVLGQVFLAHHLAWLLHYGEWPSLLIDHINGDSMDNRIVNLRLATPTQNARNCEKSKINTSGFKGVTRYRKKWRAAISVDNRKLWLGLFETPQAAHEAYAKAARKYHGEFARLD